MRKKRKKTEEANVPLAEPTFVSIERSGEQFEVARFPTTVAEYRDFVYAGGYQTEKWWSKRGWAWCNEYSITRPMFWAREEYNTPPTLPVTGVSFWEAEAYAKFREAALPTEREWYLFASNGGRSQFPWGDDGSDPAPERANLAFFGEFGDNKRVPVDSTFRSGSTEGVRDLIGNVGEWCLLGDSPELRAGELTGVLRGGACWHVPGVADAYFRDVVPLAVRDNHTGIRLIRRKSGQQYVTSQDPVSWPRQPQKLGRAIMRPTKPFRQEHPDGLILPEGLTEESWRLKIHGDLIQPCEFSLAELKQNFRIHHCSGLFVCVCRWAEENTFTGVLLSDLLQACNVNSATLADLYLRLVSTEGPKRRSYETTVSIKEAIRNEALLAWGMDDEDLTPELGWPLRYIDLSRYGYKQVKSLAELVITDELQRGWWEKMCHYDIDGTILPGTITIIGEEAMRVDLDRRGKVPWPNVPWRR